jgi:hypothetical protein
MHIILYSGLASGSEQNLVNSIVEVIPKIKIILCRTIQELNKALLELSSRIIAVVLMISDKDNLDEILTLRDSLNDRRIIIMLPDLSQDAISLSHTLRPRFIASINDDQNEVVSVLIKMRKHNDT